MHSASKKVTGFSLVEVLVVISIIGVLAAITIPLVSDISDGAKDTVARRNATQLASLSSNLAAAGMNHVIPESLGGVEATCRLLKRGVTVTEGTLQGSVFSMKSLDDEQVPLAAGYLDVFFQSLSILQLVYLVDGNPVIMANNAENQQAALIAALEEAVEVAKGMVDAAEDALKVTEDAFQVAEDAFKDAQDALEDAQATGAPGLINNAEDALEAAALVLEGAGTDVADAEQAVADAEMNLVNVENELADAK